MEKFIISILIILFWGNKTNAQLFVTNEIYSETTTIKGKYYSGTTIGSFWSIAKLDTLGRVIQKENYNKRKLLSRYNYVYNSNNDQLYYIMSFNINNSKRIDTISNYEYRYQENRIVYQKKTYRNCCDSTVIQLIENKGDTILIYQDKSYYFRPKTNATDIYEQIHTLKYKNGLLIHSEKFDLDRNEKEITYFEYYPNGRLKRREIKREPESKRTYSGGPGSDDEYYEYTFDESGRITTFYRIIGTEKYKIATYEYDKK
ncbi:MAG: hypothetical protein LBP67_02050 [Bacteroidales bacterium]|nr:hypothetical protein [Bacteroidales bacterium]